MAKTKINTTTDLIVRHVHNHLKREVKAVPRFSEIKFGSLRDAPFASTLFFACSAILTLFAGYYLLEVSLVGDHAAFVAQNSQNYLEQTAFYTGENLHSAATLETASTLNTDFSQIFNLLIVFLPIVFLWHRYQHDGLFTMKNPIFRIRKIR